MDHADKDDIGDFGSPVLQPLFPGGAAIAEPLSYGSKSFLLAVHNQQIHAICVT